MAEHASHASRSHAEITGGPLDWFANSRASWAAASVIFAAAVALTFLQKRDAGAGEVANELTDAVAPSDALARALMSTDGPPSVGALLLVSESEGIR